ncbi:MAG: hypothetical protein GY826_09720 [Fuerstiella sp.]|nr:hypothetical protein [Fuerstiella sp.]
MDCDFVSAEPIGTLTIALGCIVSKHGYHCFINDHVVLHRLQGNQYDHYDRDVSQCHGGRKLPFAVKALVRTTMTSNAERLLTGVPHFIDLSITYPITNGWSASLFRSNDCRTAVYQRPGPEEVPNSTGTSDRL